MTAAAYEPPTRLEPAQLAEFRRLAEAANATKLALQGPSTVATVEGSPVAYVSVAADASKATDTARFFAASREVVLALLAEVELLRSERRLDDPDEKTLELHRLRKDNEQLRGLIDAFGPGLRELQARAEELAEGASRLRC